MGGRREVAAPLRGQVFRVRFPSGLKPVVIVSNNLRNRSLSSVLAVRVTSAPKPSIPSIVPLPIGEPVVGSVLCDEIAELPKDLLEKAVGSLSRGAMSAIDEGLRVALALD